MTEIYSYITDFSSSINTDQLTDEIEGNVSVTTGLTSISKSGDDINITFASTISAGEKTTLDSIVSGHSAQGPIKIGLKNNQNANYGSSIHLIAGHTSAVDLVLPNQNDTLIGNSTVDILTNKTIVDSSSNIAARTLVASDGDILIDISGATEPITNQVLRATSNTSATWQFDSSGAGALFSQPTHTSLSDANTTVTIAQLKTGILSGMPTTDKTLTLPTAALSVAGLTGVAVDDALEFTIINKANTESHFTVAMGTGGTLEGNDLIAPKENALATYKASGSGTFRMRFTNVTASSEAYTVYRIS